MNHQFARLPILAFALALAACGRPTLDATSDETLEASADAIREALPPEQAARFDSALMRVAASSLDFNAVMSGDVEDAEELAQGMRDRLDGLSGPEIIALADSIRIADLEQQIVELEEREATAEAVGDSLAAFTVDRARFRMHRDYFGDPEPVFEITVTNGLDVAVRRAFFTGTLKSPDRSVPWIEDTFNYEIPGGVEPGETVEWNLRPNMFSDWADVDAPDDAVFTVEPYKLHGPDGEPIFGGASWDVEDEQRLERLRAELDDLN